MKLQIVLAACLSMMTISVDAASPVFQHKFSNETDVSGNYRGTAAGGAGFETVGGRSVLSLGTAGGYFDFGSSLGKVVSGLSGDYTVSATLYIPTATALGQNGNFVYCFANSSSDGYVFFGANESRYSITRTSWNAEQTVSVGSGFPRGEWTCVTVTQKGSTASVYFNGTLKNSATINLHPSDLGNTSLNWLGRSPYTGDVMLEGAMYADFRIYDTALSAAEVAAEVDAATIKELNDAMTRSQLSATIEAQNFDFSDVRSNIVLPVDFGNGVKAVWSSSDASLISNAGVVNRPAQGNPDGHLTLTATATLGDVTENYVYDATVRALLTDAESVAHDLDEIVLKGNTDNLRGDLVLPTRTTEGSVLTWTSSDPAYITNAGRLMRVADYGAGKKEVTLTARAIRGKAEATKDFTVKVAEDENMKAYLFTYFPSNDNENIYFAIGYDGFNYTPLNSGKCVIASDSVSVKKGLRDPHILRGEDGKTFYMVATDMRCADGWDSNRGLVLFRSDDLVNWTHSSIHFPDRFPQWKNVTHVWAPEVIWDPDYLNADGTYGRYMAYFSLLTNDGKCPYDKLYYCYINDDFTDFITDPEFLYDRGSATIDADIIYDYSTGLYHMIYKNEGTGGICQVTAERITAAPGMPAGSQWTNPSKPLQCTSVAVEGGGMFRLINSDTWILMYDCYNNGYYQFCSSEDLDTFTLRAQTATSGAFTPRHGTVLTISAEERDRLLAAYPAAGTSIGISSAANLNVRRDNFRVSGLNVSVPVRPGVDLTSFDPMLIPLAGASISPEGPQDFSAGPVAYTVSSGDRSATYNVTVEVEANPVLPGFHADPEVMFSHKTGRFYIYPTSDGYPGWGGYRFYAFSSADLVNWQREECILDLSTEQVGWATGNAWAPCIEEKWENGAFRYYFYFSGHNPDYNYKTLGCAVADSPTGPFYDLGHPMVSENVTSGQLIDSDVFTDPADGQTYFYWGNGGLVASRLDGDMFTPVDAKAITPAGGSLSTYAFREGVYVFERKGIYYFLWSVDDTGSTNYHVSYGTSTSPMGPITVASASVILRSDSSNRIYGTGHNSVLKIPGRDEWYIVYHRINRNYLSNDPGVHREVCIDRLEFNEDGSIKPVTPTHRGIDPVDISSLLPALASEKAPVVEDMAKEVVAVRYYDASGIRVAAPAPGALCIKVEVLSDGSVRSTKQVLK